MAIEMLARARADAGFAPARPRIHMCIYVGGAEQEGMRVSTATSPSTRRAL